MDCNIFPFEVTKPIEIEDNFIEYLDKIKEQYISLKKQLFDKDLIIRALKDANGILKQKVNYYQNQEIPPKSTIKASTDCFADIGISRKLKSQALKDQVADKSTDDLNTALNDEKKFEISFGNSSLVANVQNQIKVKREPIKTITSSSQSSSDKSTSDFSNSKNNFLKETKKCIKKSTWILKENATVTPYKNSNNSLKSIKNEHSRLSLKSRRLKQTRLQLHKNKSMTNAENTTFCEEAIEASPISDSILKNSNSSKQWRVRNFISNKTNKSDADITFDISNPFTQNSTTHSNTEIKESETSSVVMLTPATQDIIFLDDSCDSFNIASMDLVRDLMNPSEGHLSNLKRIESNGIRILQKPVNEHTDRKENYDTNHKNEKYSVQSSIVEKCSLNTNSVSSVGVSGYENEMFKKIEKLKDTHHKNTNNESLKCDRLFDVDCNECQTYIKYLGARLTDVEIQRHIRNCTKHKKRVEVNPTPDGFWDPLIKPLNKSDPRNETLIDNRFVSIAKRK